MSEIFITLTGNTHSGKTTIAALIEKTLRENGIEDIQVKNQDGDFNMASQRLDEVGLRNLIENPTGFTIIDNNDCPPGN